MHATGHEPERRLHSETDYFEDREGCHIHRMNAEARLFLAQAFFAKCGGRFLLAMIVLGFVALTIATYFVAVALGV